MNVSAIIVTRGNVDLAPVLDSLPPEWERLVWDNGVPTCSVYANADDWRGNGVTGKVTDLSVYGRYTAIQYASHDLIYVQDDDVIVSDPQALVNAWKVGAWNGMPSYLVANMPQEFRPHYSDSCLVGFGACFHRDAPARAFGRFFEKCDPRKWTEDEQDSFHRECDTVFTMLTPRVLVDVTKDNREFASDPGQLWRQPGHHGQREQMRDLVRKVRDS